MRKPCERAENSSRCTPSFRFQFASGCPEMSKRESQFQVATVPGPLEKHLYQVPPSMRTHVSFSSVSSGWSWRLWIARRQLPLWCSSISYARIATPGVLKRLLPFQR